MQDGRCAALDGVRCGLHPGRPLACRLYPLGLERVPADNGGSIERFVRLDPAPGSLGIYGESSTVAEFLDEQGVQPYLDAVEHYRELSADFRRRVDELVDFDRVEPREFWRRAMREALRESNYDPNSLIDALFDPDSLGCARADARQTVDAHIAAMRTILVCEHNGARVAAAAMMLSASLGYVPGEGAGVAGAAVGG
jgi:Fe-S-cluster containining protein